MRCVCVRTIYLEHQSCIFPNTLTTGKGRQWMIYCRPNHLCHVPLYRCCWGVCVCVHCTWVHQPYSSKYVLLSRYSPVYAIVGHRNLSIVFHSIFGVRCTFFRSFSMCVYVCVYQLFSGLNFFLLDFLMKIAGCVSQAKAKPSDQFLTHSQSDPYMNCIQKYFACFCEL